MVDDCSKTDVRPVIDEIGDERIGLIRHDRNQGAPTARNTGIGAAKGRYLAFLDDDDEWFPGKIEAQVRDLEAKTRYKVSFCLRQFSREGVGITSSSPPGYDGDHLDEIIRGENISSTSCVLLERECLDAVGGFRADLPSLQDLELWIRLAKRYEFAYVNQVLLTKNEYRQERITGDARKYITAKEIIYKAHKDLFWSRRKALAPYLQDWAGRANGVGRRGLAVRLALMALMARPLERRSYHIFLLVLADRYGG